MLRWVLADAFQSFNSMASISSAFFKYVRADFGLLVLYLGDMVLFVVDGKIVQSDSKELLEFAVAWIESTFSSYHFLCLLEILES